MAQRNSEIAKRAKQAPLPVNVTKAMAAIAAAKTPEEARPIEIELERAEALMQASGLYTKDQLRAVNETRMHAVWKLGKLLAKVERGRPGPAGKDKSSSLTYFKTMLGKIGLTKQSAQPRQRIGAMPAQELERALAAFHKDNDIATLSGLLVKARPYWYKASRQKKHKQIAAMAAIEPDKLGPFPLLYADPPWKFDVYSEKGLDRTPDQHYPTMTDEEIIAFKIGGLRIHELANEHAALLMWCTSSNIHRALKVMEAWGFEFKSKATWGKFKDGKAQTGLGLVFRNATEDLLYGTRGKMPGPQYQPSSLLLYPRGEHSAKPPEIRAEIELMYPDFNEATRCELFAREKIKGWTCLGFEALDRVAA